MVLNLQGRRGDPRIAEKIENELPVEVADADAARQALVHQLFHRGPRFLDGSRALHDILAVVREARRVANRRVDVFQRDGEVDNVEIEIVDPPVLQLLLADGRHAVLVVEGIPELGHEEQVGALDDALFDGAGYALAGLDFVAVI